ncbi:hypothetical protein J5N97_008074 [Dioscorea zingiberensis]|uniref:Uncharacterized protein n=1 Tax=Dioscorea zingiberensis TaxID=325984 RepID=A0A9D5HVC7_9LILI|nr:hypothetical protein J5N97_008074 [Dioscorea zingiberensis]
MDQREAQSAGDLEEETVARKRARRVSFAETTAVHVFDRDEDFETPPESRPGGGEDTETGPVLGFPVYNSDSDDSRVSACEEDDEGEEQERFVRDMNSYSPGSAAGSVTSNDDENFFGPVSTSFIKTGRYSDSGMSDDNNHDITLDSATFSLHFRNIAQPDDRTANSAGSLKTPTEVSMPDDSSNFMVPTGLKKPLTHSKHSNGKIGGSASDSNNMSLIMENPNRYDYGKISPKLEALLAEVDRSIKPDSPNDSRVVISDHHRVEDADATNRRKEQVLTDGITEPCDEDANNSLGICPPDHFSPGIAMVQVENRTHVSDMSEGQPTHSFRNQVNLDAISSFSNNLPKHDTFQVGTEVVENRDMFSPKDTKSKTNMAQEADHVNHDSFRVKATGVENHSIFSPHSEHKVPQMKAAEGQQQILELESGMHTPKCAIQLFQSPVHESVSSIRAKRQQLFSDPVNASSREQVPSSIKMELERHSERILAIKSSISKFTVPETPKCIPHISFSREGKIPSRLEGYLGRIHDDSDRSQLGVSAVSRKENVNCASSKVGQEFSRELHSLETEILNDNQGLSLNETREIPGSTVRLAESTVSFQSPNSGINIKKQPAYRNQIGGLSSPNAYGSFRKHTTVEANESGLHLDSLSKTISSTELLGHDQPSTPKVDGTIHLSSALEVSSSNLTHFSIPNSSNRGKLQNLAAATDEAENGLCSFNSQKEVEISTNVCVGIHDKNFETRNFSSQLREKLYEKDLIASSHNFISEDDYKVAETTNKSVKCLALVTAEKASNKIDTYTSQSSKDMNSAECSSNQDTVLADDSIPEDHHQKFLPSPEPFSSKDVDKIQKKRRIDQVFTDKNHNNQISGTQKSPKILPEVVSNFSSFMLKNSVEGEYGASNFAVQEPIKHWADILSKVSGVTKQSFSPVVYNLEAKQKNHDPSGDMHQERLAEASTLQEMLAYERAKLQLKHVKLNQLHKKSQHCQSGIQECHKLKSILTQVRAHGTRAFQTKERSLFSISSNSESNNQEELRKLTSMRQELEMQDKKVNQLMKSFAASCKIEGNMDCDGIIKVVGEHLDRRERCRAIHQNLQLWELNKIESKYGQCDILLNYSNLLSQRFILKISPATSISMSNSLNNTNIEKKFPYMNVCTAFEFVFKAKDACRLVGLKSLQQQTLATSLLLGTLIDVLEEVQIARIQISNLISSTFHSHCSGQLELQLCFLNCKSGLKLSVNLNMTDLNCAIYPSELSQLEIKISEQQTTLPISIFDKVMAAVQRLQGGRTLVLRLCQRVSEVVQVSS